MPDDESISEPMKMWLKNRGRPVQNVPLPGPLDDWVHRQRRARSVHSPETRFELRTPPPTPNCKQPRPKDPPEGRKVLCSDCGRITGRHDPDGTYRCYGTLPVEPAWMTLLRVELGAIWLHDEDEGE